MIVDPLVVDTYAGDGYGSEAIQKLVTAGPPWHGILLKATEGTYYPKNRPADREWFLDNWMRCRVYPTAQKRYGQDFFRGAYHYLRIDEDPVLQAEMFLALVEEAGGWGAGDLWPMVDIEQAENPTAPGAQRIIDVGSAFVQKVGSETGRPCTLYGHEYLLENGVKDTMGCGTLSVARYASTLPPSTYENIGWMLAEPAQMPCVYSWQLCGDGVVYVPGYPQRTPMGPCDYSALIVAGGGDAALAWTRDNLSAAPATPMFVGNLPTPR